MAMPEINQSPPGAIAKSMPKGAPPPPPPPTQETPWAPPPPPPPTQETPPPPPKKIPPWARKPAADKPAVDLPLAAKATSTELPQNASPGGSDLSGHQLMLRVQRLIAAQDVDG